MEWNNTNRGERKGPGEYYLDNGSIFDKQQKLFSRQKKLMLRNKYANYGFDTSRNFSKNNTNLNKSMPIKNNYCNKRDTNISNYD